MHTSSVLFVAILFLIYSITSWVAFRIVAYWFPVWKKTAIRKLYWLLTLISGTTLFGIWLLRPIITVAIIGWFKPFIYIAIAWSISQLITLALLPFMYIGLKIADYDKQEQPPAAVFPKSVLTRRAFLKKAAALTPVLSLGISSYSVINANAAPKVNRYTLKFPNLPDNLNGVKIAQISDTHLGPFFDLFNLDQTIEKVKQVRPDLLVITGDLVDDLNQLDAAIEKLSALSAQLPYGIYFCWGNHEYFRDIKRVRTAILNSPVKLLENSSALAIPGKTPLYLLGVDFPWPKRYEEKAAKRSNYLRLAKADVPENAFPILLAHHPDFIDDGFAAKIPLTLSGHTHGGQICLFGHSILPITYKYMRGFYQQDGAYGYVNVGTGHWMPFRIGCDTEISLFTLTQS